MHGIEDSGRDGRTSLDQCNRHRIMRYLMDVVRRAIERVDNPAKLGLGIDRLVELFAYEAVVREGAQQDLADGFLGGPIGLGHQVGWSLSPHLGATGEVQK